MTDVSRETSLPPIPDQARTAVLNILKPETQIGGNTFRSPIFEWGHEQTPTDSELDDLARSVLEAAWPHLHAATLRWAADRIDADLGAPDFPYMHGRDDYADAEAAVADTLRRMADEATP